jgi:hypothetical protein
MDLISGQALTSAEYHVKRRAGRARADGDSVDSREEVQERITGSSHRSDGGRQEAKQLWPNLALEAWTNLHNFLIEARTTTDAFIPNREKGISSDT